MGIVLEEGASYKLNQLARQQLKTKMLADILIDMEICKLEGWDVIEFVLELKSELDRIVELKSTSLLID